jgi:hypothetical protein
MTGCEVQGQWSGVLFLTQQRSYDVLFTTVASLQRSSLHGTGASCNSCSTLPYNTSTVVGGISLSLLYPLDKTQVVQVQDVLIRRRKRFILTFVGKFYHLIKIFATNFTNIRGVSQL